MGDCLLWAVTLITEEPLIIVQLHIFHGSVYALFVNPKMGWATFWAIFSQTHLVTLLGGKETN
jgi:hypothetical protein